MFFVLLLYPDVCLEDGVPSLAEIVSREPSGAYKTLVEGENMTLLGKKVCVCVRLSCVVALPQPAFFYRGSANLCSFKWHPHGECARCVLQWLQYRFDVSCFCSHTLKVGKVAIDVIDIVEVRIGFLSQCMLTFAAAHCTPEQGKI
jgi:hypothetical protein